MSGLIWVGLALLALPAALIWGEWPERMGAFALLSSLAIHRYYHWLVPGIGLYTGVDLAHLTLDLYLLVAFLAIALWADRQWTLWAAGAQIVAVLGHFVRLIATDVAQLAYAIMIRAPSWLQIGLVLLGIGFVRIRLNTRVTRRSAPPWLRLPGSAPKRSPRG